MNVIAHDPFISAQIARDLRVELVSLAALCARSDYLSLHMPATAETRHIFNAERFAAAGLPILDETYSAKAAAHALLPEVLVRGPVLFWCTKSSATLPER